MAISKKKKKTSHKEKASAPSSSSRFRVVGPNDVLLGRGNGIAKNRGNRIFRNMVWNLRDEYVRADRSDKRVVANRVIDAMAQLDPPGRFIARSSSSTKYVEVNRKKAVEKTCQALREKKYTHPPVLDDIDVGAASTNSKPRARKQKKKKKPTKQRTSKAVTKKATVKLKSPPRKKKKATTKLAPKAPAKERRAIHAAPSALKRRKVTTTTGRRRRQSEITAANDTLLPQKKRAKTDTADNHDKVTTSCTRVVASKLDYFHSKKRLPLVVEDERGDDGIANGREEVAVVLPRKSEYHFVGKQLPVVVEDSERTLASKAGLPENESSEQGDDCSVNDNLLGQRTDRRKSLVEQDSDDRDEDSDGDHKLPAAARGLLDIAMPDDDDNAFSLLPPKLTAFFSGISGIFSEPSHYATAVAAPLSPYSGAAFFKTNTTTTTTSHGKQFASTAEVRTGESPTTVVAHHSPPASNSAPPPRLQATHSLYMEGDSDEHNNTTGEELRHSAFAAWKEWAVNTMSSPKTEPK